jgi:M6 family metalloprotease-like protein
MRHLLVTAAVAAIVAALGGAAASATNHPDARPSERAYDRLPPANPLTPPPPGASRCRLSSAPLAQPNEGATDYTLHLRPRGELRAVMVFVDFGDAPQSETTQALYQLLVPNSVEWYAGVSKGRMRLSVTPIHAWFRMPDPSTSYGWADGLTFQEHKDYIADAIAVSNAAVDYSPYTIVYVVASDGSAISYSPAFHAYPGTGIPVDGVEIRHSATFGEDIRVARPNYGSYVLVHETGHLLGLPDLYRYGLPLYEAVEDVGGWDPMSFLVPGASFNAWHRWKLGWLDDGQIACGLDRRHRRGNAVQATLTPLEAPGRLKAIVLPIGTHTAYVVEVRALVGEDSRLCDEGVLIYTVHTNIANGSAPIRLKPAHEGGDPVQIDACGPLYDAPFDLGPGEDALFEDATNGVTVQLLASSGNAFAIRVTKT